MVQKVSVSLREQRFYIDRFTGLHPSMATHHLHQDYEIYYLYEGERIYLINGEEYVLKNQHLVFIDKNVIHKTLVKGNLVYGRIVINFRECFLSSRERHIIKQLFEEGPYVLPIPHDKRLIINTIIMKLYEEYQMNLKERDTYLSSLLSQLLIESSRLLELVSPQKKSKVIGTQQRIGNNEIEKIITYINNEFSNDISLCLLSRRFHLNEQYISRLFKKYTGCSFIDYLHAIRINEAKRYLNETTMKVNQIAVKVGYANNVQFWRVFKKITGVSPKQYRLHKQQENQ
ncbi:AraC family transcriptional regulator [Litchfieldia salsa]|uniref:AraC-like ligand binding domain-containing protein n=1 Tax=Litchfieldia salsa TaxID=930152 RepID=A0A1H0VSQ6_9BACI|nr:AraC family transcriptional regulator [Litchfieldia salsa]SDP81383.1 AraC-like ligand binding domain-containing protein [Litchfieldia salsa]